MGRKHYAKVARFTFALSLITQIGLPGDDYFGPGPRDTEYMEPGVSHKRTAAVSVSY
jgi:hypothetical protein